MARSKKVPIESRGSLTLNEAMIYVGLGYSKARKLVADGIWAAYRNGREIRVLKRSLDEWMELQVAESFLG
ncbi:MAG: excisionase family DNA-binding protein [Chthonomonas sp.]|nr:excisionase family DNA-binding protein [Chthonomonas sp.]